MTRSRLYQPATKRQRFGTVTVAQRKSRPRTPGASMSASWRPIKVAAGDRLLLTANRSQKGFRATNPDIITARSVDQQGRIALRDGRTFLECPGGKSLSGLMQVPSARQLRPFHHIFQSSQQMSVRLAAERREYDFPVPPGQGFQKRDQFRMQGDRPLFPIFRDKAFFGFARTNRSPFDELRSDQ